VTAKRLLFAGLLLQLSTWAQSPAGLIAQPDAQRTREELSNLMDRYPPALRGVLALDPSLLANQGYLAPYPALTGFLTSHPEIARDPSFYLGNPGGRQTGDSEVWRVFLDTLDVFLGFGMAIGVVVWLIRTILDYRRWSRLAKVQSEVHAKILDRFTDNAELMGYIQSHAGKRFLESSPIMLDAGTRSLAAPLGRILWSVQAGLVMVAAGIGLYMASGRFAGNDAKPLEVFGVLGIALGIGFVISAIISFVISKQLGLIEPPGVSTFPNAQ
jgi:hypothetical protein